MKWISSLSIHPTGDHFLVGSYDKKVCWFDQELSVDPYKTLHLHQSAVRDTAFHPRGFPLFVSCGDDGTAQVHHGRVFSDLVTNPMIVPLKILHGHTTTDDGMGVMRAQWVPHQPWCITAGADGTLRVWT